MSDSSARKRRHFDHDGPSARTRSKTAPSAAILRLPDVVLQHCFSFVGKGHYRYVAGTNRHFRDIYSKDHEKATAFWNAAQSVECAKLCLGEKPVYPGLSEGDTFTVSDALVLSAAEDGKVDVLEWFRQTGFDFKNHLAFELSAREGSTKVLEWAKSKNMKWYSKGLYTDAALYGHVEIFEWIYNTQMVAAEIPWECVPCAAEYGHISILRWMKEHGMLDSAEYVCHSAGRGGSIGVLKWMEANGYELNESNVIAGACSGGQKEVFLTWAQERGIEWGSWMCVHAAIYNNLGMLQWLRENGCPWSSQVVYHAERVGNDHIAEWARANGCPVDDDGEE